SARSRRSRSVMEGTSLVFAAPRLACYLTGGVNIAWRTTGLLMRPKTHPKGRHDNAMSEARHNALAKSRALCRRACAVGMDCIALSGGGRGGCVIVRNNDHEEYWGR